MDSRLERFKKYRYNSPELGFSLDVSAVAFPSSLFENCPQLETAISALEQLDSGAISNPDENRMVGHYWLRAPELAPEQSLTDEILSTKAAIKAFVDEIHSGKIVSGSGKRFEHVLLIGIGGSALGPQLFSSALSSDSQPMDMYFFDNTDPDGQLHVLSTIPSIEATLVLVVSKSGGTRETQNGLAVAEEYWTNHKVSISDSFVAVTQAGSALDAHAQQANWLKRFPMWDWVGGRTSVWSAVGLLPAALLGVDIDALLQGAAEMDEVNRNKSVLANPAAMLAQTVYHIGNGAGEKNMVILPYKDRLALFSKYLQQLVMESLGKELDRDGAVVNQGLTVFGNKGSTDQHSYVQQLRDGLADFFVVFIEVLRDFSPLTKGVPNAQTQKSGDYLFGFLQGTQIALQENGRESVTLSLNELTTRSLGALIALFERFVGIYAELINVNAYHQPGVEAGKKAAEMVVASQQELIDLLSSRKQAMTIEELSQELGSDHDPITLFKVAQRLVANGRLSASDKNFFQASFSIP